MTVRLVFFAMCSLGAGCNRVPERGEVEGVVTLNGVPLPDVHVVFTPAGDGDGTRSTGFTDKVGKYRLQSDQGEAGAPVGKYVIVVTDPRSLPNPGTQKKTRPPASRIPARYSRFSESPLKAEIHLGAQTVNLELASGKEKTP